MKRFASIWLPTFAIDRMRRAQLLAPKPEEQSPAWDKPLALVESGARGIAITAVNQPAAASGIHVGQMLADARTIMPGLAIQQSEPDRDARALERLALWLGRYGPQRNVDGVDGLWVDITGVAHLFGDEHGLADNCVSRLRRAGFQALLTIADTRSGAHALARYGRMSGPLPHETPPCGQVLIAPPGDMRSALANLPMQGLQLTEDLVILLRRLGLKQIGQLYALPRAALARRFRDAAPKLTKGRKRKRDLIKPKAAYAGWAEALVMRLDQALGDLSEPERGIKEPPVYRIQRLYAEPLISNEGIVAALDDLAVQLCRLLDDSQEGARRLRFSIYRTDGTCASADVRTSRPASANGHIVELFGPRLERMDAGLGIDAVVLEALVTELLMREQMGFAAGGNAAGNPTTKDPAVLIDRLANRLGGNAVFFLDDVESHIPECAQWRVAALRNGARGAVKDRAPTGEAMLGARVGQRPAFLLDPAEPITVIAEVPDGPPARFTWRRVKRRVVKAEGPERIAPEWWRLIGRGAPQAGMAGGAHTGLAGGGAQATRMRDYYRVEDEHGGAYWIYRAGLYPTGGAPHGLQGPQVPVGETTDDTAVEVPPAWYLHGLF